MQIQKRLLSKANLKYSKAVEIAVAMETAVQDASELQSELKPVPHVDKLTESNKQHEQNRQPTPISTAVVETRTWHNFGFLQLLHT